jgi:hypothetical protein
MAERLARVVRAPDCTLRLQWAAGQCQDCVGCGGRCVLFPASAPTLASLHAAGDIDGVVEGAVLAVRIDDARLRRAAWLGYGLALAGLLAGALAGQAAAWAVGQPAWADLAVLLGLVSGVDAGARLARLRSAPIPEIVVTPSESTSCNRKDLECP